MGYISKLLVILRATVRAALHPYHINSDSQTRVGEIQIVKEQWDFNNPIINMIEVPTPVYPSKLELSTPLGYMWNDGIMTETEDRTSPIIKKYTPRDPWIESPQPSTFNTMLENKEEPKIDSEESAYILNRAK